MKFLSSFLGEERKLNRLKKRVEEINALEPEVKKLSRQELLFESKKLKEAVGTGEKTLDAALPWAFALVREASLVTLGQRHYDVQLMGGMVLHEGSIVEMKTGEGKTLAATTTAYVNALEGKGVHVITVNDFLAKRDTVWMGQIYHALGLDVACLTHESAYAYDPDYVLETGPLGKGFEEKTDAERDSTGAFKVQQKFLRPITKREAYRADITYGTNHEFGFDYLRDNMVYDVSLAAQRGHHFAIIDEVDSILIDEARTPLIIAAPDKQSSDLYKTFARISRHLIDKEDYEVDEKMRTVSINDSGIGKVEKTLGIDNIYSPENFRYVHYLEESLRAVALFHRDKDYVVKNNEVIIVDPFTGRMLHGRRYSGGLHQAIEAKESVLVKEETKTVASITIQNYFRLYKKLAGMTGTAATSAEEFHTVYNLDAVSTPTHKPMIRKDLSDLVYRTQSGKYQALLEEIKRRHEAGQPMLIGTVAIEKNEVISGWLRRANIPHEVLNAKNHEREGEIIAQAGRRGAVTVATNMAGRGVDIILGGNPPSPQEAQKVLEVGGLHVIGTERHEARRIDNQLRGRCGRQGDVGSSQFFVSLEDEVMRIFGGDKIKGLMETLNVPEDVPIESGLVSKAIEQAQAKIEGFNFDARKHTLEYDDVLNKQRQAVYERRKKVLQAEKEQLADIAKEMVRSQLGRFLDFPADEIQKIFVNSGVIEKDEVLGLAEYEEDKERIRGRLDEACVKKFDAVVTSDKLPYLKLPMLQIIDSLWMNHLENIDALRDSVRLRAYGQHDPLVEFKREGYRLFKDLFATLESIFFSIVFRFDVTPSLEATVRRQELAVKAPSAANQKVGRNDPCPCGAKHPDGRPKKYKHCHGQ